MKPRYFDHNATTPLADAARDAWLEAMETQWLNPSSPYRAAAAVRVRYEAVRQALAARFGVGPERLVFTSGATEANNAVFRYWAKSLAAITKATGVVAINPTEHPSVIEAAKAHLGKRVIWLPLLSDGRVDLEKLQQHVRSGELAAVSVMAANNETGVLQPWREIAQLCAAAQIPYHCDASQWVGKMPLAGLSDCSYVTACAHKFGGPKGVGFMLLPVERPDVRILYGGAQEAVHRAGTEDVAGVVAMSVALEHARGGRCELRDAFIDQVKQALPEVVVVGLEADRLWNTVSMIMPEFQSVRWIRRLEQAGFLLSAGSACSTGKAGTSSVLQAMGVSATSARRVLRISSGADTTAGHWQALAVALGRVYQSLMDEAASSRSQVISID